MISRAAGVLTLLLLTACGGTTSSGGADLPVGAGGVAGGYVGSAGASGVAGTGGASAAGGGSGGEDGACPKVTDPNVPPGPAVTSWSAVGQGACAGKTLQSVVDAIHAQHPELDDIINLWMEPSIDGSFVYAFATPDGGFAIVMKRGGGDCPAGCTDNHYFYFLTDGACAPADAGKYDPVAGPTCLTDSGKARWGLPKAPPLSVVCGDHAPHDISGTHLVHAEGHVDACTDNQGSATPYAGCLTLVIAQDPQNLAAGTVQLLGTADAVPAPTG